MTPPRILLNAFGHVEKGPVFDGRAEIFHNGAYAYPNAD
jgi:hypothetical protein